MSERLKRRDAMSITYRDIRAQVVRSIDVSEDLIEGIDIDGIVRDVIKRYGLVDIDTIEHDEYWDIVRSNDATQR